MIKTLFILASILLFSLVSTAQQYVECDLNDQMAKQAVFEKEELATRLTLWEEHFNNYITAHVFELSQYQLELINYGKEDVLGGRVTLAEAESSWVPLVNLNFNPQERWEIFSQIPEYEPDPEKLEDELEELLQTPRCNCNGTWTVCDPFGTSATCNVGGGWACNNRGRWNCGILWLFQCNGRCVHQME